MTKFWLLGHQMPNNLVCLAKTSQFHSFNFLDKKIKFLMFGKLFSHLTQWKIPPLGVVKHLLFVRLFVSMFSWFGVRACQNLGCLSLVTVATNTLNTQTDQLQHLYFTHLSPIQGQSFRMRKSNLPTLSL